MGFALIAFPDANYDSSKEASLLKKEITRKAKLLNKYKDEFQSNPRIKEYNFATAKIENLQKEIQFQIEEYNRYPKKQFKIVLCDKEIKSAWKKLGTQLKTLLLLLTSFPKNKYVSGKVWIGLEDIIVEYEAIETILDEIIQKEKGY